MSIAIVVSGHVFHVEHFTCGVVLGVAVAWWRWRRPARGKSS
jgi:hypothetical protein